MNIPYIPLRLPLYIFIHLLDCAPISVNYKIIKGKIQHTKRTRAPLYSSQTSIDTLSISEPIQVQNNVQHPTPHLVQKSQISSPGERAVKTMCVSVCVRAVPACSLGIHL